MPKWKTTPWACPSCGSESILVRNYRMPGGVPPNVLRIHEIVHEAHCSDCGALWIAHYTPSHVTIVQPGKQHLN